MPHGTAQGRARASLGRSILDSEYEDTHRLNRTPWTGLRMHGTASITERRSIAMNFRATLGAFPVAWGDV